MENLGKLFLFLVAIALGFLVVILGTHVVLSIATLYKIGFITQFSFLQVYGIICLKSLLFYKYKKDEETKEVDSAITKMFTEIFTSAFFYLISWGLSYLAFSILS